MGHLPIKSNYSNKNTLLTGRNLERDQRHVAAHLLVGEWRNRAEEDREDIKIIRNRTLLYLTCMTL